MQDSQFFKQAELMLRILPFIKSEKCFALKGGTAINLFIRDMPRLSVDVDLTYLPIEPREKSLEEIGAALGRIADSIRKAMSHVQVKPGYILGEKNISKLYIHTMEAQIKIEPNLVIRGAIFPPLRCELTKKAQETFNLSFSVFTLSLAELYGGKICAALDRQHPRDLFDIDILMKAEGVTDEIRKAFVVYLVSHDRPINELLDPPRKDIRKVFEKELDGMTSVSVRYEDLTAAREKLISTLQGGLTNTEKRFLISVKEMEPEWALLDIPGLDRLPAIQWKLMNIRKMNKKKHELALKNLKTKLGYN